MTAPTTNTAKTLRDLAEGQTVFKQRTIVAHLSQKGGKDD